MVLVLLKASPAIMLPRGHGVVSLHGPSQQTVHAAHDRANGLQRQAPGHSVGPSGPIAFNGVGRCVQGGGHCQRQRHPRCQFRVHQGGTGVIFTAFHRALGVLFRVPDGGPAGDLAARPRCGGDADPPGGGPAVVLFLNQPPQGVCVGQFFSVQAAQGLSHIHNAAAAHGHHRLRGEVPGRLVGFKKLFHCGIGGLKHLCANGETGVGQSCKSGQAQYRLAPHQHQHIPPRQPHAFQQPGQLRRAAGSLDGLDGL